MKRELIHIALHLHEKALYHLDKTKQYRNSNKILAAYIHVKICRMHQSIEGLILDIVKFFI